MSERDFASDSFYTALAVGLLLAGIIALFYYFPVLWKGPWACYRIIQFYILDMFTFLMDADSKSYIKSVITSFENKPWSQLNTSAILHISRDMLLKFDLFLMLITLYPCWRLSSRPRYRRQLNLDDLIKELSLTFKFASWLTKVNPSQHALTKQVDEVSKKEVVTLDAAKGPWGLRKRIYDYCDEVGAIRKIHCPNSGDSFEYLDSEELHNAMCKQLGRKFTGWNRLKFYERWIVAALMTSIHSKKLGDEHSRMYDTMLGEASRYFAGLTSAKKVDKLALSLIAKYSVIDSIKQIERNHFFVKTVIRELFHQSKAKGIRPHFHFGWLWQFDRTLALTLAETGPPDLRGNGVEVMFSESAIECLYVRTHWLTEKSVGYALKDIEGEYILPEIEKDLIHRYDLISKERAASIAA